MKTSEALMSVDLKQKRILLPRLVIGALGNPSHLCFFYDKARCGLIVSAASKGDLDAYEISACYWKHTRTPCTISRIAFLKALQYRTGWEDGRFYHFKGALAQFEGRNGFIFDLSEEVRRGETQENRENLER